MSASSGDNQPVALVLGSATAIDLVDGAVSVVNDAPPTFPVGVTTVTYSASDAAGNTATATQLVTVNLVDATPPVVTAPPAVSVEATGPLSAIALGMATAVDVVDGILTPTSNAPASFPVGTTTVTWSATDAAGNIGTATQMVTVTDTTAPVITLSGSAATTVEAGSVYTDAGATASDLVDGDLTASIVSAGTVNTGAVGNYSITYTVIDAAGNAAAPVSRTVTVADTTAPMISVPAAVTAVSGDNLPVAVSIGMATATDLFAVTVSNDAPAIFPVGTTTVTWSATDANGNSATATQLVTVNLVDTTPPVVTAPQAVSVEATGATTPVSLGTATASDVVDGVLAVTSDAPAAFPVGTTTVTWTAVDAAGNIGTATQIVTVSDTTPPALSVPAAVTAEATGLLTTVPLLPASATDIVDGAVAVSNDAPASFPLGVTTVTYTATDAAGNIATATRTVTLVDTTPPALVLPAAVTADSSGGPISVNIGQATATDAFAVTVTNNAPAVFPIGTTTVIWTATDANGNMTSGPQLVTVVLLDTTPPVVTPPADVFAQTGSSVASITLGTATAVDNVDGTVPVTSNAPASFPIGVTTVTYTAYDAAGNVGTATQRVVVSYVSTVGGGSGGTVITQPPVPGGGATVTMEAVYWHHNDHLGTPQALTDASGRVVWTMSQTPFGIATVNEDPDGDGILVTNNFRFPGQYFDAETGLYYNYHRSYDPAVGRYPQSDPIGLNGGMNPYGYVGDNPVIEIDPFGLTKWTGVASGLSGGVGIAAGGYILRLKSDCVNHKQAKVVVLAAGLGSGFSFSAVKTPAQGSGSSLVLDDRSNIVDPSALEGFFMAYNLGITIAAFNESISFINVGHARNKDPLGPGISTDFLSIGASIIVGPSIVLSSEISSCDCKSKK